MRLFSRRFDDIYFLVGLDAFSDIGLWRRSAELFSYANFVVMVRPGKEDGRASCPLERSDDDH